MCHWQHFIPVGPTIVSSESSSDFIKIGSEEVHSSFHGAGLESKNVCTHWKSWEKFGIKHVVTEQLRPALVHSFMHYV